MSTPNASPIVLLFDLGGVIVPWVGIDAISRLTGLSNAQVSEKFETSDILYAYQIGGCSDAEFCEEMLKVFGFNMSLSEVETAWRSWVHQPFKDTLETLAKLRPQYTLGCLSNTNAMHWADMAFLEDVLDCPMASHILKQVKPDREIYKTAHDVIGVSAENIWFFDDTLANVKAAQAYGFTAFHVDKTKGVLPNLKTLGLI